MNATHNAHGNPPNIIISIPPTIIAMKFAPEAIMGMMAIEHA